MAGVVAFDGVTTDDTPAAPLSIPPRDSIIADQPPRQQPAPTQPEVRT